MLPPHVQAVTRDDALLRGSKYLSWDSDGTIKVWVQYRPFIKVNPLSLDHVVWDGDSLFRVIPYTKEKTVFDPGLLDIENKQESYFTLEDCVRSYKEQLVDRFDTLDIPLPFLDFIPDGVTAIVQQPTGKVDYIYGIDIGKTSARPRAYKVNGTTGKIADHFLFQVINKGKDIQIHPLHYRDTVSMEIVTMHSSPVNAFLVKTYHASVVISSLRNSTVDLLGQQRLDKWEAPPPVMVTTDTGEVKSLPVPFLTWRDRTKATGYVSAWTGGVFSGVDVFLPRLYDVKTGKIYTIQGI
jgi:hypothetical protein